MENKNLKVLEFLEEEVKEVTRQFLHEIKKANEDIEETNEQLKRAKEVIKQLL